MRAQRTPKGGVGLSLLLGGFVATSLGCGGQAESDAFTDSGGSGGSGGGTATGGSGGTATGGTGASGGSGGSAGGGGSGGVSNTVASVTNGPSTTGAATTGGGNGGSGGAIELCLQPLVGGNCNAYFQVYGFNAESGRCEQFVYGGCGGNDNRFESLDACLAACDAGGRENCESSSECLIDHECCGFCGISNPADLVAVNEKYASFQSLECAGVDCEYCPPPANIAPFGARCNAGTCEVYDVRTTPLSECETTEDCRLRAGLSCCEACGSDGPWVAVSTDYELAHKELCSGVSVPCLDCAPIVPDGMFATCSDGRCAVEQFLR